MEVVIDTSALMEMVKFNIRIEQFYTIINEEIVFILPSGVKKELEGLSKNKGRRGVYARIGLMLFDKLKNVKIVDSNNKQIDSFILEYCKNHRCVVFTNDMKLKRELEKENVNVYYVKMNEIKNA